MRKGDGNSIPPPVRNFTFSWFVMPIALQHICAYGSDRVTVTAEVKNTGKLPGKEVVQLYVSIPEGKLDQPYQVLAAFAKTGELKPGESEKLTLSFRMEDMASFDEESCNAILEKGSYVLHIGNSSRDTEVCAVVELDDDALVQKLHDVGGKPDFADWKPEHRKAILIPENIPVLRLSASAISEIIPELPVIDPNPYTVYAFILGIRCSNNDRRVQK